MASQPVNEQDLIDRAIAGDTKALDVLVVRYAPRVIAKLSDKIPDDLRGILAPDDIWQETCLDAFRGIREFTPRGDHSFYNWLATIARNRLLDNIKAQRAKKRGGNSRVQARPTGLDDQIIDWIQQEFVTSHTPSRSVARREAEALLGQAFSQLREDYQEALKLRYVQALTVPAIAQQMERTEAAVHKLISRGLEQLRRVMENSSDFFPKA
jgi:RNA polymerase sigma-70 factor (ECF subfamily)